MTDETPKATLTELVAMARDYLAYCAAWDEHMAKYQADAGEAGELWQIEDETNGWSAKGGALFTALNMRDPNWQADDESGVARLLIEMAAVIGPAQRLADSLHGYRERGESNAAPRRFRHDAVALAELRRALESIAPHGDQPVSQ